MIEQWGTIETHDNQTVTINFSISFSNTNYYVNELPFKTEQENDNPYDSNYRKQASSKTVNSVHINDFWAFSNFKISWFAIGF